MPLRILTTPSELCTFKASYGKQVAKGCCAAGSHYPWAVPPGSWLTVGHKYWRSKRGHCVRHGHTLVYGDEVSLSEESSLRGAPSVCRVYEW